MACMSQVGVAAAEPTPPSPRAKPRAPSSSSPSPLSARGGRARAPSTPPPASSRDDGGVGPSPRAAMPPPLSPSDPPLRDDDVLALAAWRRAQAGLSPADAAFLDERTTLTRYLLARHTPSRAIAALNATMAWRREHCAAPPACAQCAGHRAAAAHCFLPLGWTVDNGAGGPRLPVMYGSVPRAADYTPGPAVAHFVAALEAAFAHPASGPRFVWLFDMAGFTLRHAMLARVALGYATTFAAHYPERLAAVVLLNPPRAWGALLALVSPLLDARTLGKVHSVHTASASELRGAVAGLGLGVSRAQLDWLVAAAGTAPVPGVLPPLPREAAPLRVSLNVPVQGEGADKEDPCDGGGCGGGAPAM